MPMPCETVCNLGIEQNGLWVLSNKDKYLTYVGRYVIDLPFTDRMCM
jgi:hypothetical protein